MKISNFEFLKGTNDILYCLGCAAENNLLDDPNTTLVKLRMFGEATAKHLATILSIELPGTQLDLVREIAKIPSIDSDIINIFHKLRTLGNKAVHDIHNDANDAELALRITQHLAFWYYKLISKQFALVLPAFIKPQIENNQTYLVEIEKLKADLQKEQSNSVETDLAIKNNQNTVIDLQGYIAILEGKQNESQHQADQRIAALEAMLKNKDKEITKKTETDRKQYQQKIKQEIGARKLNLSELETRFLIDDQLRKAGWLVDTKALKHSNGTRPQIGENIAIAEWPTDQDENGNKGYADYVLFVGLKAMAVIEAKKANLDVSGKLSEAYRYSKYFNHGKLHDDLLLHVNHDSELQQKISENLPTYIVDWEASTGQKTYKVPFCYSANGRDYRSAIKTKSGIWYRDIRHNTNMPKALPAWHRPEELVAKLEQDKQTGNDWFMDNPDMSALGLRYFQEDAVRAVEKAVVNGQQEMLLAMATGTGKTRTAIGLMFRLIQSKRFKRVLFLVDRRSLGTQALGAFEDMRINDDTFNSIFGVKGLTDKFPEDSTKIHVATVQSLVKRTLLSDEVMPVGRYDCIIVDEAHRGYVLDKEQTEGEEQFRNHLDYVSAYRRIIDHFDAIKVALTATPAKHTSEIFGAPVYRYTFRQAVIDGYLNDQEPPIKITTELSEKGLILAKGSQVERLTFQGDIILDDLEDEQNFEVADFNRQLIAPNFNKAICGELTHHLDPTGKQKTLIFCVSNSHADMVVEQLREVFSAKYPSLEHDAIIKITGTSDKDPEKIQTMINRYNKERLPNIVVTVDLLSTGIDIPSICNLVFLRKVRSRILYEQMKGRATRLCPEVGKVSFKIFDAVDLYATLKSVDSMQPVVIRPKVDLQTLVNEITDSETYQTKEADGRSFAEHSHEQLVSKLQRVIGQANFYREKDKEIGSEVKRLDQICEDVAGCDFTHLASTLKEKGPLSSANILNQMEGFVGRIERLKKSINKQSNAPIFTDIPDKVIEVERLYGQHENAVDFLEAFDNLVSADTNAHIAMSTVINKPRDLTRKSLVELQEWFDRLHFDESTLRVAWKETKNQDVAARLVGHIRRAAIGDALLPFEHRVDHALERILKSNDWSELQNTWLKRLATSLKENVVVDDNTFKMGNYKRRGGKPKLSSVFDGQLDSILTQFSDYIWEAQA
ncbi:type I restriction-modification system endonuclease [Psychromonas sp. MB-3u-54]|uniref:type I restriction-modification system endonuclease n=1 Tax=Psychromonas sp. MB-3u-54 TaxID=2058319 RepID=UPI000C34EB94|nr:type I restriction-modification system endonuclease [Psychromonas sp. MB-3u-54]PKH03100.1 type I restriction-modification system endonuclease [Psychromonas sp. MB-3u-54]